MRFVSRLLPIIIILTLLLASCGPAEAPAAEEAEAPEAAEAEVEEPAEAEEEAEPVEAAEEKVPITVLSMGSDWLLVHYGIQPLVKKLIC